MQYVLDLLVYFSAGSLKEFGLMLEEVTNEWTRTIERAEIQLIKPLEV